MGRRLQVAAVTLTVTHHAHQRLRERFGWPGTRAEAADALMGLEPVQRAWAHAQRTEETLWRIALPDMEMELRLRGPVLMTVVPMDGPSGLERASQRVRHRRTGRREPRRGRDRSIETAT